MVNVDSLLKSTLEGLGVPVERLQMQEEPERFITYRLLLAGGTQFADDENEAEEYTYRIDIYAKSDYIGLLINLKTALRAAGFYGTTVDPEMYERDTGYYHVPVETKYLTEV